MFLPFKPKLKKFARRLRNHSTLGEVLLWNQLKRKQILGYDFHRQKPIDKYIVDFYCYKLKLIIEVDGSSHNYRQEYDRIRQNDLEQMGFRFLRFQDKHVRKNMEEVVQEIINWIETNNGEQS